MGSLNKPILPRRQDKPAVVVLKSLLFPEENLLRRRPFGANRNIKTHMLTHVAAGRPFRFLASE